MTHYDFSLYKEPDLFGDDDFYPTSPSLENVVIGQNKPKNVYCHTIPREWTDSEIEFLRDSLSQGWPKQKIADMLGRSLVSVSIKAKRLGKSDNTYNEEHLLDKYDTNRNFVMRIKPRDVLDVYCGVNSWYKNNLPDVNVVTNDKDESVKADYHLDALKFVCQEYCQGRKYDIVDLDPFGSCYECVDLSVKMARKGIVVTFGEMGHKRFKRLDFVRRFYGIDNMGDFTTQRLIDEIAKIGRRNTKELIPVFVKEWRLISRVYFEIKQIKITEQWNMKRNGE